MCHILQTIYYSTINILAAHWNIYVESIPIHRIKKPCVYQNWNHWEGGVNDTTLRARILLLLMFLFFCLQWLLFTRGCQMMSNWFGFCRTIRTGLRYLKILSRHNCWVLSTKAMISHDFSKMSTGWKPLFFCPIVHVVPAMVRRAAESAMIRRDDIMRIRMVRQSWRRIILCSIGARLVAIIIRDSGSTCISQRIASARGGVRRIPARKQNRWLMEILSSRWLTEDFWPSFDSSAACFLARF